MRIRSCAPWMLCVTCLAQNPLFKTAEPKIGKVSEEMIYYYKIMSYQPAARVDLAKSYPARTPETAAMQILHAMSQQDYDGWLRAWTPSAQEMLKDRDHKERRTPAVWKSAWARAYSGCTAALTTRIETGPYVIVVAAISHPGQEPFVQEFVMTQVNGTWFATQDLASDPVLLNWKTPEIAIKRVARK